MVACCNNLYLFSLLKGHHFSLDNIHRHNSGAYYHKEMETSSEVFNTGVENFKKCILVWEELVVGDKVLLHTRSN
jgi:hypothetical protein